MDNQFRITAPCYNASQYIAKCLNSIKNQSYKQFKCCVIDDCSDDNSYQIALDTVGNDSRFSVIKNEIRQGALYNIKKAIEIICPEHEKESIIVNVDGDDALASDDVFAYLNQLYIDNPKIWVSYGEYKTISGDPSQNGPVDNTRKYRKSTNWCTSHIRTYKKKLWDHLEDSSFRNADGNYFMICPDLPIMYGLIEMAGKERIKYVNDGAILYIYNDISNFCEFRVNPQLLAETRAYIENQKEYNEIIEDI